MRIVQDDVERNMEKRIDTKTAYIVYESVQWKKGMQRHNSECNKIITLITVMMSIKTQRSCRSLLLMFGSQHCRY